MCAYLNNNNLFEILDGVVQLVLAKTLSKSRVDGSGINVLPGMSDSVRTEPFNGFLLFHLQRPNWYLAWATRIR